MLYSSGCCDVFFYFPLKHLVPYWGTTSIGQPWQHTAEYQTEQRYVTRSRWSSGCRYVLRTEAMAAGFHRGVCIPEEMYKRIPESGIVTLHGTSSWFGVVVESFEVPRR